MITRSWTKSFFSLVSLLGSVGLYLVLGASDSQANQVTALRDEQLKMQVAAIARQTMPESCDSPYKDVSGFNAFFDSAIFVIASEKGPDEKGVSDLFAVSELQKKMMEIFPNVGEESPVDRLVIAQLCRYREVFKAANARPDAYINIPSDDPQLQKHLLAISGQLFLDSRELMVNALSAHARTEARRAKINLTVDRVEKARERGRNKLEGLFRSFR